jgi:signal transduction histidine kinase
VKRRGSIISAVLAAFAVFAVLIGAATVTGYVAVERQNQATKQLSGNYQVLQHAENVAGHAFRVAYASLLTYTITRDRNYLPLINGLKAQVNQSVLIIQERATADVRGLAAAQAQMASRVFALFPRMTSVRQGTPGAAALMAVASVYASDSATAEATMEGRLNAGIQRLAASGERALSTGLAWVAAALGVAVLLVLAGSLSMLGAITRPLYRLAATVRRLTAGEFAARAAIGGSAEVREVAQAINAQADESDRLRAQEAEANRLRAMARAAGIHIREPLAAAAVIEEACTALEHTIDADVIHVRLITNGQMTPPGTAGGVAAGGAAGGAGSGLAGLAGVFTGVLPGADAAVLDELLHTQASQVTYDIQGPGGERLPRWLRGPLRQAGVGSQVLAPFGKRDELLGFIAAHRLSPGRRWSAAEIDAVESISADLGRGLNHARTYEALKSLDEAKSDFFATVSHELRAPLTSIEGYIEMLSDEEAGPITQRQRQMLRTIDRSASRLRGLIDDVFTLAELESGAFATVVQPVDISEIVHGAVEAIQPAAAAAKVTLRSTVPHHGALIVEGNPGQLDRVLLNLLSNAVKYTPSGGKVHISATTADGSVTVQVTDTGIGIPPAEQQNLFTRFYRASNARQSTIPGSGLGLAIVRTIITGHHGDITLQSQQNTGTTVTIQLPKHLAAPNLSA